MENIENSSSIHTKSCDEFIINEDANMLICNNELDNYMNVLSPHVVEEELQNVNLPVQIDISNNFNNCEHPNFDMVDINPYDQSSGDKLNSLSKCGYDFEQEYSFDSDVAYGDRDEVERSSDSPVIKKHKKETINDDENYDDTSFLIKDISPDKFCDVSENDAIRNSVVKQGDYDISNESVDFSHLVDRDIDYNSENVPCLENNETAHISPKTSYNFSNQMSEDSMFCPDTLKKDVKVVHRHNECALANDFFETVENINLNISEKQNNLKSAVDKLVDVIKESHFENRINTLIEISDKNSESIEQFKKKSEDCIHQCRKFETISENLMGDCVNTLAQASVCYANWVSLHASDLKQIDTDLADIESFIETINQ